MKKANDQPSPLRHSISLSTTAKLIHKPKNQTIEIAATIVESHDFFECGETSVMKVRTAQADVTQAGSAELTNVVGITGHLKAAGVFGLRANSDVMKCVVAEKAAGVADIAAPVIENALAALFGSAERGDLLDRQIERCPI